MQLAQNAKHLLRCQRQVLTLHSSSLLAPLPAAAAPSRPSCCCESSRYTAGSSSSSSWGSSSERRLSTRAAATPSGDQTLLASTHHPLIDWVQRKGGAVNGIGVANLAGSDGGSGWGLVATQVRGWGSCCVPVCFWGGARFESALLTCPNSNW